MKLLITPSVVIAYAFSLQIIILSIISLSILIFFVYSNSHKSFAEEENWKKYLDSGQKFSLAYPPNWTTSSIHDNKTGTTQVTLTNPNSTRALITVLYNPNDPLLSSKSGKPVVPSRALTNLENQTSSDYIFFNSTGKFPHKYSIKGYQSASDIVDFEKSEGKPGKMLILFTRINDKDSLVISYSESKRLFYKSLPTASQIINSTTILQH